MNTDLLVPAPSVAASYVNRDWAGFTDHSVMEASMASGHNVMLYGPTGSGKTHSVRAFAASKGLPYYTVALNGAMDLGTVIGSWVPTADGSLEWADGVVTSLARQGKGVILLDEINMAPERNIARFYGLLDSRREIVLYEHNGEVVRVPGGSEFLVVAAYNPGYRGTRELSQALPNRFAFKLRFGYDASLEANLVASDAVMEVAAKLRGMSREIRTPVSTNMQVEFVEIALAFSVDFAIDNFVAAFTETEQPSVAQVMDLYRDSISNDINELAREDAS